MKLLNLKLFKSYPICLSCRTGTLSVVYGQHYPAVWLRSGDRGWWEFLWQKDATLLQKHVKLSHSFTTAVQLDRCAGFSRRYWTTLAKKYQNKAKTLVLLSILTFGKNLFNENTLIWKLFSTMVSKYLVYCSYHGTAYIFTGFTYSR